MLRLTTATGLALTALAGWCSLGADRRRQVLERVRVKVDERAPAPRPVTPFGDRQVAGSAPTRNRLPLTAVFVGSDRPLPRRTPDATRTGFSLMGLPRQRTQHLGPAPTLPEELALRPVPLRPSIPRQRAHHSLS